MQSREKQAIESYERVQDFLAENPVPPPGAYGEPKAMLDEVLARLKEHGGDQLIGARFARAEKDNEETLSHVLRTQHLRPISLIARAQLAGSPGIDKVVRLPRPNLTTTALLTQAQAFRAAAVLYETVFVNSGRPADFIAQLDAAINAVRRAFRSKATNVGKKAGAKLGLKDEIARGRRAVEMLDAIVTTGFAGNGQVLARWRSARRIRAVGGGVTAKGEKPTTVSAPAAPSTESPVPTTAHAA
jgi:hypothetical protein